jgi:putative transcriptional regulator
LQRLQFLLMTFVLLILPPTFLWAALPKSDAAPDGGSLAGQLLIASPDIGDPRFDHAVILMMRHDKEGAFGIIVNRPIEERSLAGLLREMGEQDTGIDGSIPVFAGGPVEPGIGFVVHSADYHRAETLDIDGRVAMTPSREILHDIGHHKGPVKFLVAFGYAGWGPGQLENELAQHGWFTTPEDSQLTFDENRARVWETAMARRARDL